MYSLNYVQKYMYLPPMFKVYVLSDCCCLFVSLVLFFVFRGMIYIFVPINYVPLLYVVL